MIYGFGSRYFFFVYFQVHRLVIEVPAQNRFGEMNMYYEKFL